MIKMNKVKQNKKNLLKNVYKHIKMIKKNRWLLI